MRYTYYLILKHHLSILCIFNFITLVSGQLTTQFTNHSLALFLFFASYSYYRNRQKTMIRVVSLGTPQLSTIKTITQILPLSQNQIILLGYSTDSLKRIELVYEIYDVDTKQTMRTGIISKFGVIFLTNYVSYDESGSFLTLVSAMGTRRIVR